MGTVAIVQIIIGLAQGVLSSLTAAKAPQALLSGIQNGINEFKKVHGTLVTKAQVDAHTSEFKW